MRYQERFIICHSNANCARALRIGLCCISVLVSSCSSRQNSNKADADGTQIQKSGEFKSLVVMLQNADRAACADETATEKVINLLIPKYISLADQKLTNQSNRTNIAPISPEMWQSQWKENASLTSIVATNFDDFSKKIYCHAEIEFTQLGRAPVDYTIQPTSDNSDLVFYVNSPIQTGVSHTKSREALYAMFNNNVEGASKVEASTGNEVYSFSAKQNQLINKFFDFQNACQGGGNDTETENACARWGVVEENLRAEGICYGRKDQVTAEYRMHRCDAGSL